MPRRSKRRRGGASSSGCGLLPCSRFCLFFMGHLALLGVGVRKSDRFILAWTQAWMQADERVGFTDFLQRTLPKEVQSFYGVDEWNVWEKKPPTTAARPCLACDVQSMGAHVRHVGFDHFTHELLRRGDISENDVFGAIIDAWGPAKVRDELRLLMAEHGDVHDNENENGLQPRIIASNEEKIKEEIPSSSPDDHHYYDDDNNAGESSTNNESPAIASNKEKIKEEIPSSPHDHYYYDDDNNAGESSTNNESPAIASNDEETKEEEIVPSSPDHYDAESEAHEDHERDYYSVNDPPPSSSQHAHENLASPPHSSSSSFDGDQAQQPDDDDTTVLEEVISADIYDTTQAPDDDAATSDAVESENADAPDSSSVVDESPAVPSLNEHEVPKLSENINNNKTAANDNAKPNLFCPKDESELIEIVRNDDELCAKLASYKRCNHPIRHFASKVKKEDDYLEVCSSPHIFHSGLTTWCKRNYTVAQLYRSKCPYHDDINNLVEDEVKL